MDKDKAHDFKLAIGGLKRAVVELENSYSSNHEVVTAFDNFTKSTKEVAAIVLEDRIASEFQTAIGEDGKSVETADEKIARARQIRDLLSVWNFAFLLDDGSIATIDAQSSGRKDSGYSNYSLRFFGEKTGRTSAWHKVKDVLCSPNLVDASKLIRQNARS